jgi:hypothetical protein
MTRLVAVAATAKRIRNPRRGKETPRQAEGLTVKENLDILRKIDTI